MTTPSDRVRELHVCREHVFALEAQLKKARDLFVELEERLFFSCRHEWIADRGIDSHRTEYVCKHCDMPPGYYRRSTAA